MKKACLLFTILLVFQISFVHAQQYNREFLQGKVDRFSKMKKTGAVMIGIGAASVMGGMVLLSNADWEESTDMNGNTNYSTNDPDGIIGMLFTGLGVGLMGGGIPLAIIGNKKSLQYKKRLDELTLIPYVDQKHAGFYLSLRF